MAKVKRPVGITRGEVPKSKKEPIEETEAQRIARHRANYEQCTGNKLPPLPEAK